MNRRWGYAAALLAVATAAGAQAQGQPGTMVGFAVVPDGQAEVFGYRASTVVEARITQGRPYTAEATTEFTQVLADGNRIARKNTVRIYRDSDGRTRREELAGDGSVKAISIYDPVAQVTYVLDPATKTARKSTVRVILPSKVMATDEDKRKIEEKLTAEREAGAFTAGRIAVAPAPLPSEGVVTELRQRIPEAGARGRGGVGASLQPSVGGAPGKEESLGQKLIEGVMADGKRVTTTVPAGTIGNQQPITVLSEQWFSPDLEILVMTRHSDPRSGETSYTLDNIVRAEPAAGLFDVPSDYRIVGTGYQRSPAQQ